PRRKPWVNGRTVEPLRGERADLADSRKSGESAWGDALMAFLSPLRGFIGLRFYPRLTPWAEFLRRFAAKGIGCSAFTWFRCEHLDCEYRHEFPPCSAGCFCTITKLRSAGAKKVHPAIVEANGNG